MFASNKQLNKVNTLLNKLISGLGYMSSRLVKDV